MFALSIQLSFRETEHHENDFTFIYPITNALQLLVLIYVSLAYIFLLPEELPLTFIIEYVC